MKTFRYEKLVRDKTAENIARQQGSFEGTTLNGEAKKTALKQKFLEEIYELFDAETTSEIISELADVLELLYAWAHEHDITTEQMEAKRKSKKQARGGFYKGLFIKTASFPKNSTFYNYCLDNAHRYPEVNNN